MEYLLSIAILVTIYAALASSLNIVLGHGGLLSLSHAAFYGLGAYISALLALTFGWGFLPGLVAAAVGAGAIAALLAVPLLRLRGDYFILGSLGFQIILIDFIHNADAITNGPWGLSRIPRPEIFGVQIDSHAKYLILYAAIAALIVLLIHYFMYSPFGRTLHAVREDEIASTAVGKNVKSVRIRAFAVSAGLAAIAGSMYAHYVTYIDPSSFTFIESVYILSLVIVGGVATTRGPLLGALILVLAPEVFRFIGVSSDVDSNLRQLLYGMLLILFAMLRPRGVAGKDVF